MRFHAAWPPVAFTSRSRRRRISSSLWPSIGYHGCARFSSAAHESRPVRSSPSDHPARRLHKACAPRHRFQRFNLVPRNDDRPVGWPHRWALESMLRFPIHGNRGRESPFRRMQHQRRPDHRAIAARRVSDVGSDIPAAIAAIAAVTAAPPRIAATHPRRPAPPERAIEIPRPAGVRHEAPRIARNPRVAELRRPHPLAASVRVPARIGRHVG